MTPLEAAFPALAGSGYAVTSRRPCEETNTGFFT